MRVDWGKFQFRIPKSPILSLKDTNAPVLSSYKTFWTTFYLFCTFVAYRQGNIDPRLSIRNSVQVSLNNF